LPPWLVRWRHSVNPNEWRLADIARYLNVSKQRAHQLAADGRLPAPAGEDHRGRYWKPDTVRAWAQRWSRERPWRRLG
jgi:hypothetical protein